MLSQMQANVFVCLVKVYSTSKKSTLQSYFEFYLVCVRVRLGIIIKQIFSIAKAKVKQLIMYYYILLYITIARYVITIVYASNQGSPTI